MFGLVRFSYQSYGIYSMKNITRKPEHDACIVKHQGAKYEAVLIMTNEKKENLKLIQEEKEKNEQKSVGENSFVDCHIGIEYVEINRSSNSFINQFDDSVFSYSGDQDDTDGLLQDIAPVKPSNETKSMDGRELTVELCMDEQLKRDRELLEDEESSDVISEEHLDSTAAMPTTLEELRVDKQNTGDRELPEEEAVSADDELEDDKEPSEFEDNSEDDPNYELSASEDSPSDANNSRDDDHDILSRSSILSNIESCSYREESHRDNEENPYIPSNVSKDDSMTSAIRAQLSASLTEPGCDDENMKVTRSRGRKGDKKANFCFFCHTKQQKIDRHLESKHKEEVEVRKFISLPKGNIKRANIIGKIRKQGNFLFNTNKQFNDGELIVSRRPTDASTKSGKDFRACANCRGFFSKQTLRVHFKSCTGIDYKAHRLATVLSRKITGRIHSKASQVVKNDLFPPLRDDDVTRSIRFDELIIIFANKMVEKYREPRHFQMIRQRMRLLGNFLINMKKINSAITNLTSVFDPKYVDEVMLAINMCARYTESSNCYEAPSVAFSLGTLLKQIGNILITQSIKNHDDSIKKNTKDFLKVFTQEVNINVNRTVAETQLRMQRRKSVILPSMSDIKKLCDYLTKERNNAVDDLKQGFSPTVWLKLAEATLTSIQLFNRRRAGEVERITIEDFETFQTVERSNNDLFQSLPDKSKEIARKYVRFTIRGKLNRTVPVLLDTHLLECIRLILEYRTNMKVSKQNPYVFGIAGFGSKKFPHLQACHLMRKFSEACGADYPTRLRGTNLRKHIATTCITLNLESQDISDLSNFMGHSENIHKGIYRQPILSREILGISKLLEAAQGVGDAECTDDDESEGEQNIEARKISAERYYANKSYSSPGNHSHSRSMKRKIKSSNRYGTSRKVRWTNEEKDAIFRIFGEYLKKKELPSLKTIQSVIKETPILQNRTSPQIKTWIHNQFRSSKKKLSFSN